MHDLTQQLASALTGGAIVLWTLLALAMSTAGGALAGMKLGGKDLGSSLAALMGAMYGPVAAVPGILLGLIVLRFV